MKELSIEEKAKRYDEVLSIAKEWYNNPNSSSIGKSYLYAVFSELKDSEDERIRKALIQLVNQCAEELLHPENARQMLAWLEKQDKKIDAIENFDTEFEKQISRLIASIINKDYKYTKDFVKWTSNALLNYAKYEIEKQGEQKPLVIPKFREGDIIKRKDTGETFEVSKIEAIYADEIYYHLTNGGCVCENSDNFERVEKKSVTDLRTWKYIVDAVLTEKEGIGQYLDSPFTEEVAKKLQKRFGNIEQEPAWSEEDNINCKRLLYLLNGGNLMHDHKIELFIWMESLKDRYTWKPSDEQMEALLYEVNAWDEDSVNGQNLKSLYQELKKLREE